MSKTTIKRDVHGLYIRGAGYIWRADYPVGYVHAYGPTVLAEGDIVSVSHSGGPMASIRRTADGTREKWYSHGSYIKDSGAKGFIPSEDLYRPDYKFWPEATL